MFEGYSKRYLTLINLANKIDRSTLGHCKRYHHEILTSGHIPPNWIFDLHTNPPQLRLGINSIFNPGAIYHHGKYCLVARIESYDRKSFFAIAESDTGIDQFQFKGLPIAMPQNGRMDTNVYDMRLTQHEDGWIYGLFCVERRPLTAPQADQSVAEATCGIVRTKDLKNWERLPDLVTEGSHQRNVVLHPEFVNRKYALYTRPQDGFIETGSGGGIGWALTASMENAEIFEEKIIDPKIYHTVNELKNGQGPAPIKTKAGWLHLAHGVRNTAAGLRYVLYTFITSLKDPSKVIYKPGGYFMAPEGSERTGDVSNVLFCNGWIARDSGDLYIYYASSDTRIHVATTTVSDLVDYCINTPADPLFSQLSVHQRLELIQQNEAHINPPN